MHMQQSVKELLYSLPIAVEFAGMRGTTVSLAKAGWDLSMKQGQNNFGGLEFQLALRHGDRAFALYALSHPITFPHGEGYRFIQNPIEYARFFNDHCFNIAHIANEIQFRTIPVRGAPAFSMSEQFSPIDPYPSEREHIESMKDFKFFKTMNPSVKDLIVHPDQVPELLDVVLRAQQVSQEEIKRRAETRRNYKSMQDGSLFRPAHTVQAQILTLAV